MTAERTYLKNMNIRSIICGLLATVLLAPVCSTKRIELLDLDSLQSIDITEPIQHIVNGANIESIGALDMFAGGHDEWLAIETETSIKIFDILSFELLFEFSESSLRSLWSLSEGKGFLSALHPQSEISDLLLYFDESSKKYFFLNPVTQEKGVYIDHDFNSDWIQGFGYKSDYDDTIFRNHNDSWSLDYLDSNDSFPIDWSVLWGVSPLNVTELKITTGSLFYQFIVAVLPGSAATPTPQPSGTIPPPTSTPQPGTPTPPAQYFAAIAMNLSESIWAIDGLTLETSPNIALTGQSPNQILCQNNICYSVNSLSHSIYAYSVPQFQHLPGHDIALGSGRNPFQMECFGPSKAYVSNFIRNSISVVDLNSSTVIKEIPLPDSAQLPHDSGTSTYARPEGLAVHDNHCYIACCNLDGNFVAGGPGVICVINTDTDYLESFFESGGRNAVDVVFYERYPDWLWTINAGDYDQGYAGNGLIGIWSISQSAIIHTIQTGAAPFEILISDTKLYVADGSSGSVLRYALPGFNSMTPIQLPGSGGELNFISGLALDHSYRLWILAFNQNKIYIADTLNNDALTGQGLSVGQGPESIVFIEGSMP